MQKSIKNIIAHFMFSGCCGGFAATTLPNRCSDALNSIVHLEYCIQTTTRDSFLKALSHFRMRHATDIRDKIHGLLGLAMAEYHGPVKVDYTQSPEQVLRQLYSHPLRRLQRWRSSTICMVKGNSIHRRLCRTGLGVSTISRIIITESKTYNFIMHRETEHRRVIISHKGNDL